MTKGNQKWSGATPNFKNKPNIEIKFDKDRWELKSKRPPNRIKPEPNAWTKKYLIADSVCWRDLFEASKGKKDIKFSSRPNQMDNQLEAEREIIVPEVKVTKNKKLEGK
jgi:hypothetical protein